MTSNASLVILNCPSCLKPIIYHKKKCLPLTSQQTNQIETANHESAIYEILQRIIQKGSGKGSHYALPQPQPEPVTASCSSGTAEAGITRDDITNLKIELETCTDAQAFINKM
ncbi:MAG: hypothetical protein GF401_09770 [Chitinivibrionales bacterium]|nr:hypothetical protein [Chitinivibrionales bacterium]